MLPTILHPHATKINPVLKFRPILSHHILLYSTLLYPTLLRSTLFYSTLLSCHHPSVMTLRNHDTSFWHFPAISGGTIFLSTIFLYHLLLSSLWSFEWYSLWPVSNSTWLESLTPYETILSESDSPYDFIHRMKWHNMTWHNVAQLNTPFAYVDLTSLIICALHRTTYKRSSS